MLDDSERLLATIEQILRAGRMGAASRDQRASQAAWGRWAWTTSGISRLSQR